VIGRVTIHPGQEDETLAIFSGGVVMAQGMAGSAGGCWARTLAGGDLIQHSFWLFDTDEHPSSGDDIQHALHHA